MTFGWRYSDAKTGTQHKATSAHETRARELACGSAPRPATLSLEPALKARNIRPGGPKDTNCDAPYATDGSIDGLEKPAESAAGGLETICDRPSHGVAKCAHHIRVTVVEGYDDSSTPSSPQTAYIVVAEATDTTYSGVGNLCRVAAQHADFAGFARSGRRRQGCGQPYMGLYCPLARQRLSRFRTRCVAHTHRPLHIWTWRPRRGYALCLILRAKGRHSHGYAR